MLAMPDVNPERACLNSETIEQLGYKGEQSMRNVWKTVILACFLVAMPLMAQAAEKIAICSPEEVLQNSESGKRALADLKSKADAKQQELQRQGDELKQAMTDFQKKAVTLSADAKAKQQQDLEGKMRKLQEDQNAFNQQMGREQSKLMNPLFTVFQQVVADYAKKNGYSIVLEKRMTIYNEGNDITADITKEFDSAARKSGK
jgi:outer membrane protein